MLKSHFLIALIRRFCLLSALMIEVLGEFKFKILSLQIENTLNTIPGFIKKNSPDSMNTFSNRYMMSNKINTSWGILFDQHQNSQSESYNKLLQKLQGNCISMLRVKVLRKPLYLNLYISFKVFKII